MGVLEAALEFVRDEVQEERREKAAAAAAAKGPRLSAVSSFVAGHLAYGNNCRKARGEKDLGGIVGRSKSDGEALMYTYI